MRPTFSVIANGQDITGTIGSRLVSLEILDTVDEKSDGMTVAIEDTQATLALPTKGARLEVSIGWNGANQRVGSYVVDEVSIDGPPDVVTITASSSPFVAGKDDQAATFTARKTRSWSQKTIGEIVATIAGECGLEPVVDEALKNIQVAHIVQATESDANLLLRLARRYGAVLKPADGRLVFASEDGGRTTSGKELGIIMSRSDVSSYRVTIGGKLAGIKSVRGRVHDYKTGQSKEFTADVTKAEGSGTYYERTLADSGDEEAAKFAAQTTAKRIQRYGRKIELNMLGRNDIVAGMRITLSGFREGINGKWKAVSVRHTISRSGWLTVISGELAK